MSVKSVQFTVAAHIMAALGYYHGEEVSSAILANSVNADPTFVRKSLLQALEGGLGRDKEGQERSECACASSATDHAARHIPCQCSADGIYDSFVSDRQEVSGQLQPQGMHVGRSFSSSGQFRKITRENYRGRSR